MPDKLCQLRVRRPSKDKRPRYSRAVALRGPLKKRPPQGDGDEVELASRPRHCERSEAIQNPSAERLWIASLRSQ